jgi:catechol 2,3-dioxygenase-like lactoylglutathione lyase family enzyme
MPLNISKDSIDIGLVTANLEAMLGFYRDTLGLAVEGVIDLPIGQMTRLTCGTTVIKLVTPSDVPDDSNPAGGLMSATGIRYYTISVDNLEEATRECEAAGYNVVIQPRESRPGVRMSMIEDPDRNWVELLQRV